jgi:hypothetical protein
MRYHQHNDVASEESRSTYILDPSSIINIVHFRAGLKFGSIHDQHGPFQSRFLFKVSLAIVIGQVPMRGSPINI